MATVIYRFEGFWKSHLACSNPPRCRPPRARPKHVSTPPVKTWTSGHQFQNQICKNICHLWILSTLQYYYCLCIIHLSWPQNYPNKSTWRHVCEKCVCDYLYIDISYNYYIIYKVNYITLSINKLLYYI